MKKLDSKILQNTSIKPFIFTCAICSPHTQLIDAPTDTDPLPAIVVVAADGITSAKQTRITRVGGETTDDQ